MLLYNEEECFCIKTGLLNFKYCSTNLDMLGSRLLSNGLIFSDGILVKIQLVIFLLLSDIRVLSTGAKTKKIW